MTLHRNANAPIETAIAVELELTNASLSKPFETIDRDYDITHRLENLTKGKVHAVVALTDDDETGSAARGVVAADTSITVAVLAHVANGTKQVIDPYVILCGEIRNLFRLSRLPDTNIYGQGTTGLSTKYDKDKNSFTGFVYLTFKNR